VTRSTASTRRGFTLLELLIVAVIMGILAASVLPALAQNRTALEGAARDEVARRFVYARARALAAGAPIGVMTDTPGSSLTIRTLDDAGNPDTLADPIDDAPMSIVLPDQFRGVTLDAFVNGDGTTANGTVWFDYQGEPHTRTSGGDYDGPFSQNALITLTGGGVVEVHAYSGAVEAR